MADDWRSRAACKGHPTPEIFYPTAVEPTAPGIKFCKLNCPVINDCLQYALDNHERLGIWGGTSQRERVRLQRERVQTGVAVRAPMRRVV